MDRFLQFFDVSGAAQHILNLLRDEGETGLDAVRAGISLIRSLTGKDLAGIFAALDQERTDVAAIIAAVKVEFSLN